MEQIKKRRNPFAVELDETPVQSRVEQPQNVAPEVIYQEQPQQRASRQAVYEAPRTQQQTQATRKSVEVTPGREKYTSTMEKTLRRQIKIACVNRGLMFAEFVEEACREKLQREGMM